MYQSTAVVHPSGTMDQLAAVFLALLAATGSLVFMEPAPYDALAIAMFAGFLVCGLRYPRELAIPLLLLMLFLIGNSLAALLAEDPLESIRSLAVRIYMVLTFLLLVSLLVRDPRKLLDWLWAGYLVAAVIAVIWATGEYAGVVSAPAGENSPRARGGFKDPNVYGPFLIPAVLYVLNRLTTGSVRRVPLYGLLLILFSVGVLLSFSRGAWLNLALSVGIFGILSALNADSARTRLRWLLGGLVSILLIALTINLAVHIDAVNERFTQRAVLTQAYDLKEGGRFDTQRKAIIRIGSDPIGVGPGRSDEVFGLEPHNLYLHVFVEAGWLGGLSFTAFLLLTLGGLTPLVRRLGEYQADATLVGAALGGLLVQSFFIDSTHWRHLWLLLAIAWALIIFSRRSNRKSLSPYKT